VFGVIILLIEVSSNEHLKRLLSDSGFLLNIDYPTRNVKLHRITCTHSNPDNSVAVKPSSKRQDRTGEIWYSDKRKEANSKAIEVSKKRGFRYSFCHKCKP
jgi:hypothetical protein